MEPLMPEDPDWLAWWVSPWLGYPEEHCPAENAYELEQWLFRPGLMLDKTEENRDSGVNLP